MPNPRFISACLTLLACLAAGCHRSAIREIEPHPWLVELDWLCGDWTTHARPDGSRSEEHWMPPSSWHMFGIGRSLRDGKEVFVEYLRISAEGSQVIYYAAPGGRLPATPFRAIERGPTRAVFENLEHDYPQRIIYELQPSGDIRARIEGVVNGQKKSSDWYLSPAH